MSKARLRVSHCVFYSAEEDTAHRAPKESIGESLHCKMERDEHCSKRREKYFGLCSIFVEANNEAAGNQTSAGNGLFYAEAG